MIMNGKHKHEGYQIEHLNFCFTISKTTILCLATELYFYTCIWCVFVVNVLNQMNAFIPAAT